MGCICSKEGSDSDEGYGRDKESRSSKRLWIGNEKPVEDEDVNAMILVKSSKSHNPTKNNGKSRRGQTKMSRVASMPNGDEATWIAAGWPSWLTAVAGDAISGLVPRGADTFEKLEKIGQGTYSSVYKARDVESGKLVAMKKVRFANMDPESVRFMAREIRILRKLNHPNVMKLECLVTSRVSSSLYLVFEYMEHDLTGLAARPGVKFTESQIKCYMQQLFHGLEHCHSHGVLHRDIKGSNLLIDNDGNLKIADFGLATSFHHNQKQPLTSRVVTLWYRPPELLLGSTDYGVAVDLWSAGCILAELFNGKPIMPGRTEVEQLHKIFKICGSPSVEHWQKSRLPYATMFKPQRSYSRRLVETFKDFPSSALTLLDVLLHVEPEHRGSASLALESEFFTSKPLPCDLSTLPKYPPSKEFDVRLRDEEARRRKAAAKGLGQVVKKEGRKTQFVPVPEANAELKVSIQGHYVLPKPKSNSEKLNRGEDAASGFRIDPPRGLSQNDIAHSLLLLGSKSFSQPHKMQGRADEIPARPVQTPIFHASQRLFKLSRFASSIGYAGGAEVNDQHDERASNKDDSKHSKIASNIEDGHPHREGFKMEYAPVDQLHRSGPLLPAEENIHEMLKENEKKIQQVVRKARFDRTRNAFPDNVQSEFVLT